MVVLIKIFSLFGLYDMERNLLEVLSKFYGNR
jgi:hypothetical protein